MRNNRVYDEVDDFSNKIIMSHKAHFHFSRYVNKKNCCFWGTENPREAAGQTTTHYKVLLTEFFLLQLSELGLEDMRFQQDSVTAYTERATSDILNAKQHRMLSFRPPVILIYTIPVNKVTPGSTLKEITGLLDEAEGLTSAEINALIPLFDELKLQYDFVAAQIPQKYHLTDEQFEQQYEITLKELEEQFSKMLTQKISTTYNTSLPTLTDMIGKHDLSLMATEQRLELLDLQGILQDTLYDTQLNLNNLTGRALRLEEILLKLNKPKVLTLIFKALQKGYKAAGRIGRAAYCTYSYVPQLNTSLHTLYEGADCYTYTTALLLKIQNETYQTVKTVRKNVLELAAIYKKVILQNSLMGKIVTVILNITKIAKNVLQTIQTAEHVLDDVAQQLPAATDHVMSCSSNTSPKISFVLETVSNVTECIVFKEETTKSYDFLQSEVQYNKSIDTALSDALLYQLVEEDEEESQ